MTAATLDVTAEELTDEELEKAPPCECLYWWLWEFRKARRRQGAHTCGKPSKIRLRMHCGACGAKYLLFLCGRHTWWFKNGLVTCRVCDTGGQMHGFES